MGSLETYKSFKKYPLGEYLFSKALCFKAPYFSTISPKVLEYEEGLVKIKLKKSRAVLNHIGTIHAVAMCNLAELCGGLAIDSILPKEWRWIPKGMNVEYLKKAETDLTGYTKLTKDMMTLGDNEVFVEVKNKNSELVFRATINMYVSTKEK